MNSLFVGIIIAALLSGLGMNVLFLDTIVKSGDSYVISMRFNVVGEGNLEKYVLIPLMVGMSALALVLAWDYFIIERWEKDRK